MVDDQFVQLVQDKRTYAHMADSKGGVRGRSLLSNTEAVMTTTLTKHHRDQYFQALEQRLHEIEARFEPFSEKEKELPSSYNHLEGIELSRRLSSNINLMPQPGYKSEQSRSVVDYVGRKANEVDDSLVSGCKGLESHTITHQPDFWIPTSATGNSIENLRKAISHEAPGRPLFIPMLAQSEALPLIECFFAEVNASLPLFCRQTFMNCCERDFPVDQNSGDSAWWACLNAVLAIAIRLKTINSDFKGLSKFFWSFFKNAFSVYNELLALEPSILGIQAVLAMATFTRGSADLRTTVFLTSTAIRMVQVMGLHQEDSHNRVNTDEAEQRRCIVWIAYELDTYCSNHTGLDPVLVDNGLRIQLPSEDDFDRPRNLDSLHGLERVNVFRHRIELAIMESKILKLKLDADNVKPADQVLDDNILELHRDLIRWRRNLPVEIRPGLGSQYVTGTEDLSVLMLQLAYYHCISLIHLPIWVHGAQAVHLGAFKQIQTALLSDWQLPSSKAICLEAARSTLRMRAGLASLPFTATWLERVSPLFHLAY